MANSLDMAQDGIVSSQAGTTQNDNSSLPPGLSLVGVDAPSRRQAQYQTPQPTEITPEHLFDPKSTIAPLQEAGQATIKAGDEELQGAQQRLQSVLQGNQATQQSISAAQGAAIDEMKSSVNISKQDNENFQQVLGIGNQFALQQYGLQQAHQLIAATQEVEQFKQDQTAGGLMQNGLAPARQQLAQILGKYKNIPTDKLLGLLNSGSEPLQQYASKVQGQLFDEIVKQRAANAETIKAQYNLKIAPDLAALGSLNNTKLSDTLNSIQSKLQELTADPNIDTTTKMEAVASLMGETAKRVDEHDVQGQQGLDHLQDAMRSLQDEAKINSWERAGVDDDGNPVTPEKAEMLRQQSRVVNRQATTAPGIAYDYNQKQYNDAQELQQKATTLQQSGLTTSLDKLHVNSAQLGYLTWQAIQDNGTYEFYKNTPGIRESGLAKSIVSTADDWNKYNSQKGDLAIKVADAQQSLAKYHAETVDSLIEKARTASPQKIQELSAGDAVIAGLLKGAQKAPLTPDQYNQLTQARSDAEQRSLQVIQAYKNIVDDGANRFQPLGLVGNRDEIQTNMLKNKGTLDSINQQVQQATANGLVNTNSSYYSKGGYVKPNAPFDQPFLGANGQMAKPASFATGLYHGTQTILPFQRGAQATILDNYAQDRGLHTHAGIDLPVPDGTRTVSVVNGKIAYVGNDPTGYGKYVDVKGDDGMLYRYAHLSSTLAHVGMSVAPGVIVGLTGHTGDAEGPHLHFEVRADTGTRTGFDGTVDPLAYLQSHQQTGSYNLQPRGNTDHQYSTGLATTRSQEYFPTNALPVPGGYLLNGRFYKQDNNTQPAQSNYSNTLPIRNGFMSSNPKDYPPNNPNANYGYASIAQDPQFAKAISKVATEIGIPAVWLADVMGSESGHSHSIINSDGCVGLIQFCPGSQQGFTAQQIASMSPAQQTLNPVRSYLKDAKSTLGQIRTPAELQLAIFGGAGRVLEMRRQGSSYNIGDKNIDRISYMKNLFGAGAGRHYEP